MQMARDLSLKESLLGQYQRVVMVEREGVVKGMKPHGDPVGHSRAQARPCPPRAVSLPHVRVHSRTLLTFYLPIPFLPLTTPPLLHQLESRGEGVTIMCVGESGVGKSSLISNIFTVPRWTVCVCVCVHVCTRMCL